MATFRQVTSEETSTYLASNKVHCINEIEKKTFSLFMQKMMIKNNQSFISSIPSHCQKIRQPPEEELNNLEVESMLENIDLKQATTTFSILRNLVICGSKMQTHQRL